MLALLKKKWRHVAYNISEGGLRQVLQKVTNRVREFVRSGEGWDIYYLDVREYAMEIDEQCRSERADFAHLKRIGYSKAIAFPEHIRERFATGATCHVLYVGETWVTVRWTIPNILPIVDGVAIHEDGAMGVFDGVTPPEHRRRGYGTQSHIIAAHHGKSTGMNYVLGAVDSGNIPSIKSLKKAGYRFAFRLDKKVRFGRLTVVESQHSADFLLLKQSVAKRNLS